MGGSRGHGSSRPVKINDKMATSTSFSLPPYAQTVDLQNDFGILLDKAKCLILLQAPTKVHLSS